MFKEIKTILKKLPLLIQGLKFVLVGILNTAVDFGVLNLLMWVSKINQGLYYSVFKGVSFTVAVINSYFWNKYWTFQATETKNQPQEAGKFFLISIGGFLINVGLASLVVNIIGTQFGISQGIWANVGAIIGTMGGMVWNFVGYKFWAFKNS